MRFTNLTASRAILLLFAVLFAGLIASNQAAHAQIHEHPAGGGRARNLYRQLLPPNHRL